MNLLCRATSVSTGGNAGSVVATPILKYNPHNGVTMIDIVIIAARNGSHVVGTSEHGKDYILDTEFAKDLSNTWCEKSSAINVAIAAAQFGLNVIACEDSPYDIKQVIRDVKDNTTEKSSCEHLESLIYSGQH